MIFFVFLEYFMNEIDAKILIYILKRKQIIFFDAFISVIRIKQHSKYNINFSFFYRSL